MLRKSIALIMSVCMLLSLCACGKSDNKKSNSKNSSDESNITDTYEDNPSFETPEDNTENFTTTTTKPAVKLSESCSMVLCSGTDGSDYYELVANQIDGYPDSTFEFGVIKNNQWLVPMGSDCPFIDDKGWWIGAEYTNEAGEFKYLGQGCFFYEGKDNSDEIIYKPETNVSFSVINFFSNPAYGANPLNDKCETITFTMKQKRFTLTYLNLNTGEEKIITIGDADYQSSIKQIGELSDGLFFAYIDKSAIYIGDYGFYDLDGNRVINLDPYKETVTDYKNCKFTDGKYTFTVKNSSNILFDITIDTTGKVLSQEKVES